MFRLQGGKIEGIIKGAMEKFQDESNTDHEKEKRIRIPITYTSENDLRHYKRILKDSEVELAFRQAENMQNFLPSAKDRPTR